MARIKVTETRSELRKTRYRHLISLGFSAKEARRRRDHSSDNIRTFENTERERITKVRPERRSVADKNILGRIRHSRRTENRVETGPRLKPKSERAQDFAEWSGERNFPSWADKFIADENDKQNLDPFNSYGYRRFWHHYVQGLPIEDIGDLADRGDSNLEQAS